MRLLHMDHEYAYYGMKKGAHVKNKVKIFQYVTNEDGERKGGPTLVATVEDWEMAELYFINNVEDLMREE